MKYILDLFKDNVTEKLLIQESINSTNYWSSFNLKAISNFIILFLKLKMVHQ
jgi:hypothetical protein